MKEDNSNGTKGNKLIRQGVNISVPATLLSVDKVCMDWRIKDILGLDGIRPIRIPFDLFYTRYNDL